MPEAKEDLESDNSLEEIRRELDDLASLIVSQTISLLDDYFRTANIWEFEKLLIKSVKFRHWRIVRNFLEALSLEDWTIPFQDSNQEQMIILAQNMLDEKQNSIA